jgi:rhamnogalacturonyl hydrolase YesR
VNRVLESEYMRMARGGGDYLVRHFDTETGMFDYRYDPAADEVLGNSYNLLRHAGTAYALLELYEATGEASYRETAERAIEWLLAQKTPCPTHPELWCLYEGDSVKLGGSALAILAMVEHVRVTGDARYVAEAEELARWILHTQGQAGSFLIHKQDRDGAIADFTSMYYPGEAIFALARLREVTQDEQYDDAARRAALWLITVRDFGKPEHALPHDHWLLYGLNELNRHEHDQLFVLHAQRIARAITAAQHRTNVEASWVGGFYDPPSGTPTATRVEGLSAAHDLFIRNNVNTAAENARQTIELGTVFMKRVYIDKEKAEEFSSPVDAYGGFMESLEDTEVRIDYVQHAISALLGAERVLEAGTEIR